MCSTCRQLSNFTMGFLGLRHSTRENGRGHLTIGVRTDGLIQSDCSIVVTKLGVNWYYYILFMLITLESVAYTSGIKFVFRNISNHRFESLHGESASGCVHRSFLLWENLKQGILRTTSWWVRFTPRPLKIKTRYEQGLPKRMQRIKRVPAPVCLCRFFTRPPPPPVYNKNKASGFGLPIGFPLEPQKGYEL